MGRKSKEIKAVLHPSNTEAGKRSYEKKICDFYAAQVGKKLHSYNMSKKQRLEILQLLMDNFNAAGKV